MMSLFRRGLTAKILLGFLGLALFAMVITGFGAGGGGIGSLGGLGASQIATAGDEELTTTEVSLTVDRQFSAAREQRPELDIGTFLESAFDEILRQLISVEALRSFAKNIGFGVSKAMVDAEILKIPAFQNLAGQFDETSYREALAQQNLTDQQVREDIETGILQRLLLAPLARTARVPETLSLQYASLLLERRAGTVGVVPAEAMPEGPAPTAQELAAYFQQNKARYTVPERRVIRYALFGNEQLGNIAPTDAEIAEYYRANAARYAGQETRTLSQLVLPTQQAAQQFVAKLQRGTSFDQAAAEAGFGKADTSIGQQNRGQFASLTSAAVAGAAFGAAQGGVTQPVKSDFGWHIVRVDAISRAAARTLEQARQEIIQTLTTRKRQEALGALVTRIEDAIGEGQSLDEVARANRLRIQETPPVTAAGRAENAQVPPEVAPLIETAFDMDPEEPETVVETVAQNERYAAMTLGRVVPAAPPALAQIEERVRADLIAKRRSDRARQVAASIVARINAGTPPAQAFAQAGVSLPAAQPVNARRIEIARSPQVPVPLRLMFSMKKGTAKLAAAPNGAGWFVVHLAETQAGDASKEPGVLQGARAGLTQDLGSEYVQQFVKAVEIHEGVERNEDAIRELKRQLQGGAPAQ